jgi:holliday junction DNA helicase RuvA
MIGRIRGKLLEKRDQSIIVDAGGIGYEILVPAIVFPRLEEAIDGEGHIQLVIYHYLQITQSSGTPVLIGFINEIERDFFLRFITVSGIGPRAAVKALNKPISEIAKAIDVGDFAFLKTLPGIGAQRAKEIIAKLQGKIGKFGLMRDQTVAVKVTVPEADWQKEAMDVLLQLQYKKPEAATMIQKALEKNAAIATAEDLLNEIYKQRTAP